MRIPSWAGSVVLHVLAIAVLLLARRNEVLLVERSLLAIDPLPPPKISIPLIRSAGGGGDPRPASGGRLPRFASVVFIRPVSNTTVLEPALPMEAGPVTSLAGVSGGLIGVPFGVPGPP